jgi:hypothetical protein
LLQVLAGRDTSFVNISHVRVCDDLLLHQFTERSPALREQLK